MGPTGRSLPTGPGQTREGAVRQEETMVRKTAEAFVTQPWMHHTQGTPRQMASHLVLGGEWESVDRNRLSECSASLQQRG